MDHLMDDRDAICIFCYREGRGTIKIPASNVRYFQNIGYHVGECQHHIDRRRLARAVSQLEREWIESNISPNTITELHTRPDGTVAFRRVVRDGHSIGMWGEIEGERVVMLNR